MAGSSVIAGDYIGYEVMALGGKVYLMKRLKRVDVNKSTVAKYELMGSDMRFYTVSLEFNDGTKALVQATRDVYNGIMRALY